ncbi:Mycoplasma virulence family signal region [Metamycoplasma arthritidis]|uniref:MspA/MspB/MIB-like signal-anchor domain-contatining protein n=1 Tax=Metamycoplasma arthritidis TaxID=2111 RepID=UPI0010050E16|nr:cell surface protein [Metamycoplasma arthritidis]VEU78609.1 Mycoplasma virulence family signal region [Metamycoplasma arthritidis]
MSHAKKKKIAIIVLASTAALLAAGTVSGVLYAHQSATKRSKGNDKKPEIQDISELEKKIETIRDSHKQNLKNEAWKILEALKITIRNAKKANNVRDLSQVISDFERLIPLGEAYLAELKKLPELEALANDLKNVIDLAKEALKEAKEKLLDLQQKEKILKDKLQTLLNKIAQAIAKEPNANDVATIEALIAELKTLQIESDDLSQSLKAAKLLEELKLLNDANLKIKETISVLQKRLIAINPEKQKEITKQANQKILDLEKSQKDVENANDISTLPNAIKKLEKDLEDAKSLEKDAKDNGLNDVAKKLQDAINKGEEALKKGKEKEQKIIEANNALIKKVNELVAKITKDVNDANRLSTQSEDSLINNTKAALEEDVKQSEKLAKQAEDATLLAEVNKIKDAKDKAEEALKKINEIIAQKQAIELAKLELQKSLSELDKATKNANLADDESTLPTAIASLASAIANSNTTLAKYEDLKENEVIKPHYDALKNYLTNEAKSALEQAKNRQEAKKQAKAQIDKDLAKAKADYEGIKNTIDALESTDKIAELQNIINNNLPTLKDRVKGIEQSAENTKYPEAKEKAKELLKQIDKLTLEAQAKLEKLKKDKETQELENKKLQDLRQELEAVIKNLGIVSDRAKSHLVPGASANNIELAKAIKEIEEQLANADDTRAKVAQANKQAELTNELNKLTDVENIAKDLKAQLLAKIEASNQDIANKITEARAKLSQYIQNANEANDQKNLANLLAAMNNLEKLLKEAQDIQTLATKVGSNKLAEAQTLTNDVNKALSDAEAKYKKLKKSLEDEQSLLDSLNKAIEKQSKTLNDAKQGADKATTIDGKDSKYSLLDKALQDAKTELDKMKEEAKDLKDQANKDSINNKIENLEKQISDGEEDLKKKQEALAKDKEKNDKLIKDLTDEANDAISKANDAIQNPFDKNKTKEAEDALKDAHKKLNEEKDKLKGDAQNLEKITKKLEEIDQKQQDLADAKKQQEQSEETRAKELAEQAKKLQTELENLVKELKEKIKFTEITAKANEIENKINNINENFLKAGGEANKLKDHDHLKDAYKKLKKAVDDATKEASDAKNKITTDRQALNDRFKSLEASTTTVKNDLNSAGNDQQKLNEVIGKLEGQNKLLEQVQKLIEDITKVDPDSELLAKAKGLQTELNSALKAAQAKLKTKAEEIAKLNESLERKAQELTAQTNSTNAISKENVDTLDTAIKKLEELKNQANTLKTEINTKRVDNDIKNETEQKYQALVKAIKDAQDTIDNKKTELAAQKAQNKTNIVDPAIEKAKDTINALNNANDVPSLKDALENKQAEAKQSLEQAIQQLEKDKDNKKLVEDKLKELEDAAKKAKEKLDKLNQSEDKELQKILSELNKIEKSLKDAKDAFGDSDTIDQKTTKKDALQIAIDQAKNDLQTQSEKANKLQDPAKKKQATDRIDQINQAIKDTYQPLVETKENEIQQAKTENSQKVDSALTESKKSLEQADQAIGDDNSNFDKSQKLDDAKTKLNETQQKLNDLKNELAGDSENQAKVQDELTKITKKLQDLERAKQDLKQSQDQKAKELAKQAKELANNLNTLAHDLDSLWKKSEVNAKKTEITTIVNKANTLINDPKTKDLQDHPTLAPHLKALKDAITNAQSTINKKDSDIQTKKQAIDSLIASLKTDLNAYQQELTTAGYDKSKLQALIAKIEKLDDSNAALNKIQKLLEQIEEISYTEKQTEITNLKNAFEDIIKEAKRRVANIAHKINDYNQEINTLISDINNAKTLVETTEKIKVDDLDAALRALEQQLNKITGLETRIKNEKSSDINAGVKTNLDKLKALEALAKSLKQTKEAELEEQRQANQKAIKDFEDFMKQKSKEINEIIAKNYDFIVDKYDSGKAAVAKVSEIRGKLVALENQVKGESKWNQTIQAFEKELTTMSTSASQHWINSEASLGAELERLVNILTIDGINNIESIKKLEEFLIDDKFDKEFDLAKRIVNVLRGYFEFNYSMTPSLYKSLFDTLSNTVSRWNRDTYKTNVQNRINLIKKQIVQNSDEANELLNKGFSQTEIDTLKTNIISSDSIKEAQSKLNEAKTKSQKIANELNSLIKAKLAEINQIKTNFKSLWENKIGHDGNPSNFVEDFTKEAQHKMQIIDEIIKSIKQSFKNKNYELNNAFNELDQLATEVKNYLKEMFDKSTEVAKTIAKWKNGDLPEFEQTEGIKELTKSWNFEASLANLKKIEAEFANIKSYWPAVQEYATILKRSSKYLNLLGPVEKLFAHYPDAKTLWDEIQKWNSNVYAKVLALDIKKLKMSELEQILQYMKTSAMIDRDIFSTQRKLELSYELYPKYTSHFAVFDDWISIDHKWSGYIILSNITNKNLRTKVREILRKTFESLNWDRYPLDALKIRMDRLDEYIKFVKDNNLVA